MSGFFRLRGRAARRNVGRCIVGLKMNLKITLYPRLKTLYQTQQVGFVFTNNRRTDGAIAGVVFALSYRQSTTGIRFCGCNGAIVVQQLVCYWLRRYCRHLLSNRR
jgi:hypothetical protein